VPQSEEPQVSIGLEELVGIVASQLAGQHKHDWAIIGVKYPDADGHPRLKMQNAADLTYVALKCACGEVKTVMLNGHWELSELVIKIGETIGSSSH